MLRVFLLLVSLVIHNYLNDHILLSTSSFFFFFIHLLSSNFSFNFLKIL